MRKESPEIYDGVSFEEKLGTIGLSPAEYQITIDALLNGDVETIRRMNALCEERISQNSESGHFVTTQNQYRNRQTGLYLPERELLHGAIVDGIVSSYVPQSTPSFRIFAGPPGAGKTTAQSEYQEKDRSVGTDPTHIQKKLHEGFNESDYQQVLATKDEAFDIAEKLIDRAFSMGLSIMSESTLQNTPWATRSLQMAVDNGYSTEIVFIHKDPEKCFRDAIQGRARPVSLNYLLKSLRGYRNLYYFDRLDGVRVTVIRKSTNADQRIVYQADEGRLEDIDEFSQIVEKINPYTNLVI